jgi:DNA modification methylase
VNTLYFGDNLQVLREHVRDESVDLVYLDPPFNSARGYNLLFRSPKGHESEAQITAFGDTWHWGPQAEREFDDLLHQANTDVAQMMQSLRSLLGDNDMMAYLTMMAGRLLEMRRVLKPTGSLYLHCDPTASHYLKIVLDAVFGAVRFTAEIIWKRYGAHNDAKTYGAVHDTILFYTKTGDFTFEKQHEPYDEEYVRERFTFTDPDGRRWAEQNLQSPNPRPNLTYVYTALNGISYQPPPKGWKCEPSRMRQLDEEQRLHYPRKPTGRLRQKNYMDELPGVPVQDVWTDLIAVGGTSAERLGYPTQKPLALLERIIAASSNEGDVVLDPFCGCGTTIHAAHKLKREWIGIDITHLAIRLIEKRMRGAFGDEFKMAVEGTPRDLDAARDLAQRDKYQFQWWAVSLVDAQPYQGKKKGADTGIDGLKFFRDVNLKGSEKIIVNVKGGEHVGPTMVKDLIATVAREKAEFGLFVTLTDPTPAMVREAAAAGFYTSASGKRFAKIQILTIEGLLDGTQRAEHPDYEAALNFKESKREDESAADQLSLLGTAPAPIGKPKRGKKR